MDTNDSTLSITCKQCGETYPATKDYFHTTIKKDRLYFSKCCIACRCEKQLRKLYGNADYERRQKEKQEKRELISTGFQKCIYGDECVHPDGPILPLTPDYFEPAPQSHTRTGWRAYCRSCNNSRVRTRKHKHNPKKLTDLLYIENLKTQGLKRCGRKDNCIHPKGPVLPATLEYFPAKKQAGDGLGAYCLHCRTERQRDYYTYKSKTDASFKAKHNIKSHNRRQRNRHLPNTLQPETWLEAIEYWHGCCAVCGRQLSDLFNSHKPAMDHWIPVASANCPGTVPYNILPLCHGAGGCNNSKGKKDPVIWLTEKLGKRAAKKKLAEIEAYFDSVRPK